jgi:four helix bundle protein
MQDFHKLRVYQQAHRLTLVVYATTNSLPVTERYGLTSQMRRASVSIVSNITEGAGRGGKDFRRFLRMALGSAFELEGQLCLCNDLQLLGPSDLDPLVELSRDVQKMLGSLISSVGSSPPTRRQATKNEERETRN